MKKSIIFLILICAMAISLCGSVAAADDMNTTIIPSSNHVYINVSNDNGVKYNIDYDYYLHDSTQQGYNPNGTNGTYYIKAEGGGLNQLHITYSNSTSTAYGQVNVINSTSTSNSGVFYITTTGGRGSNDNIILLLSVKGPIPDNFNITITSYGYTWTLPALGAYNPSTPTDAQHITGINETFTKDDFLYGPQTTRPAPGGWQPLYSGQDTNDPSTAEYLMFIDLYVGNLMNGKLPNMIDNGAIKVEYTINNLNTTASFNAYAWTAASNQGVGISWVSPIINNANPCVYTVNYTPVTPVADFTADTTSGSDSLTVKFTDQSTNYPTSWTWDFGDGTTSTEQNPTHTYSAPGNYTVKLTATNLAGNDTVTKTNYITVLDAITPTVTADPKGGNYDTAQSVILTADEQATIYYTTDGSEPTTSSAKYTGPISINATTTLKFFAVDEAGNQSPVYTETYNIKSDVYVNVTPSNPNPQVGDKVTYTFKLGNNGPGIAKDVIFTYVIPEGVEFAGANVDQGTWTYDESTRTLTWNLGDVAVGDPYLWLDLNILNAGSFNIQPLVSVAGYGLEENIGSLLVNAVSVPTNNDTGTTTVNAATKTTSTIPMQETGVPLAGLTMALLLVGSGLALGRRK